MRSTGPVALGAVRVGAPPAACADPAAEAAATAGLGVVDGDERQRDEGGRQESEKSKACEAHHGNRVLQLPASKDARRAHVMRSDITIQERESPEGPGSALSMWGDRTESCKSVLQDMKPGPSRAERRRSVSSRSRRCGPTGPRNPRRSACARSAGSTPRWRQTSCPRPARRPRKRRTRRRRR